MFNANGKSIRDTARGPGEIKHRWNIWVNHKDRGGRWSGREWNAINIQRQTDAQRCNHTHTRDEFAWLKWKWPSQKDPSVLLSFTKIQMTVRLCSKLKIFRSLKGYTDMLYNTFCFSCVALLRLFPPICVLFCSALCFSRPASTVFSA